MTKFLDIIKGLTEPAARTIRRGEPVELARLGGELDEMSLPTGDSYDDGVAVGYWQALASAVEIAADRAVVDKRIHLVQARKRALPVLHELAQRRWTASSGKSGRGMKVGELAGAVGILPQNMKALIDSLEENGLVTSRNLNQSRRVEITDAGVTIVTHLRPEWHLAAVEQSNESVWNAAFRKRLQELNRQVRKQQSSATQTTAGDMMRRTGLVRVHDVSGVVSLGKSSGAVPGVIISGGPERFPPAAAPVVKRGSPANLGKYYEREHAEVM